MFVLIKAETLGAELEMALRIFLNEMVAPAYT